MNIKQILFTALLATQIGNVLGMDSKIENWGPKKEDCTECYLAFDNQTSNQVFIPVHKTNGTRANPYIPATIFYDQTALVFPKVDSEIVELTEVSWLLVDQEAAKQNNAPVGWQNKNLRDFLRGQLEYSKALLNSKTQTGQGNTNTPTTQTQQAAQQNNTNQQRAQNATETNTTTTQAQQNQNPTQPNNDDNKDTGPLLTKARMLYSLGGLGVIAGGAAFIYSSWDDIQKNLFGKKKKKKKKKKKQQDKELDLEDLATEKSNEKKEAKVQNEKSSEKDVTTQKAKKQENAASEDVDDEDEVYDNEQDLDNEDEYVDEDEDEEYDYDDEYDDEDNE